MGQDNVSNSILKFFSKPIVGITLYGNIIDGVGALEKLAKSKVRVLVLHGQMDGAVPPRHLNFYQEKIQSLIKQKKLGSSQMKTVLFPNLYHEEINNYAPNRPQDFNQVWQTIEEFISSNNNRLD